MPCGTICCGVGQTCSNGTCSSACAVPCGASCCAAGQSCVNGVCSGCANPCGTSCCGNDVCVNGSCCPQANACGATCCSAGAICIMDQAGNKACAVACQTSSQCGGSSPCCALLNNNDQTGACVPNGLAACRCTTGAECAMGGACAPATTNDVVSHAAYICVPDDGLAWHGCNGFGVTCGNGYDCWGDSRGNKFCARSCNTDAQCGNPGIACCNTAAACDNAIQQCSGAGGCMTCQ